MTPTHVHTVPDHCDAIAWRGSYHPLPLQPSPLIFKHWTLGGTGVSNFEPEKRHLYKEAIRRHGDSRLVLSDRPYRDNPAAKGLHSLHHLAGDDLSEFWRVFRTVEEDYARAEKIKSDFRQLIKKGALWSLRTLYREGDLHVAVIPPSQYRALAAPEAPSMRDLPEYRGLSFRRTGKDWTLKEDYRLRDLFARGWALRNIVAHHQREPEAILYRLSKITLRVTSQRSNETHEQFIEKRLKYFTTENCVSRGRGWTFRQVNIAPIIPNYYHE